LRYGAWLLPEPDRFHVEVTFSSPTKAATVAEFDVRLQGAECDPLEVPNGTGPPAGTTRGHQFAAALPSYKLADGRNLQLLCRWTGEDRVAWVQVASAQWQTTPSGSVRVAGGRSPRFVLSQEPASHTIVPVSANNPCVVYLVGPGGGPKPGPTNRPTFRIAVTDLAADLADDDPWVSLAYFRPGDPEPAPGNELSLGRLSTLTSKATGIELRPMVFVDEDIWVVRVGDAETVLLSLPTTRLDQCHAASKSLTAHLTTGVLFLTSSP
jgi:hypothetical protein